MKTKSTIIFMVTVILGLSLLGCTKFIEVDLPVSQLTGPAVYQDQTTATAALSDIYARLRNNGVLTGNPDGTSMVLGLYTDELAYYGTGTSPLESFFTHGLLPSNTYASSLWSNSYGQVYAANALLEGLENSPEIPKSATHQLQGEALFIRAVLHFYLVNLYGDIPFITTTDYQGNAQVQRLPASEVMAHIIGDLEAADQKLTYGYPAQNRVRANKGAVRALLARAHLYLEQWSLADMYASDIIGQTALYAVEDDLDAAFLKGSISTIWQLHPGVSGANTLQGKIFSFSSGPPAIAALTQDLVSSFGENDLRGQHWVKSVTQGVQVWYHPYKYKLTENTGVSQEYSIVLRLEEQILIRAEARANLGDSDGAKQDLNTIRNRAGLENTTATTTMQLLAAIQQERKLELFTEFGHRWFDLKRNGMAEAVLSPIKPAWEPKNLLFPLPESELLLNPNLEPQNTGY
ncbi:RagB/SusD family nutrient uptake outer membrane protein [Gelidibacter salicanalis]|nr:RagB/SusD family nutrient uptake outer membrane protein [Gelidibacter salicanalis]